MIAVAEEGGRIRPQVAAVKSVASAICIGVGGSVGREGPIVQIGSALASSLGQWVRMPENRLRMLVACGAAGGIAATFNAPITGVFFGVEIILRAFSVEAVFTVMLSAMVADLLSRQLLGDAPFLSGLPSRDRAASPEQPDRWPRGRRGADRADLLQGPVRDGGPVRPDLAQPPEWARPAAGGILLGLLLLALPQMYGVGYPVPVQGRRRQLRAVVPDHPGRREDHRLQPDHRHRRVGRGVGPSLFIGATSGMAFGETARHLIGPAAGQPALYAVVAMGAVFASAARVPLTSVASVVEMTGDFALTLPVMLAVAIATATSRGLSYGTIYTTKLLRRGTDIDRVPPADPFQDLAATDADAPLPGAARRGGRAARPARRASRRPSGSAGTGHPPALPSGAVRQRIPHPGRAAAGTLRPRLPGHLRQRPAPAGLAHQPERAAGRRPPSAPPAGTAPPQPAAGPARPAGMISAGRLLRWAASRSWRSPSRPARLPPGRELGDITWPPGCVPVSVQDARTLRDPDPGITLAPGEQPLNWHRTRAHRGTARQRIKVRSGDSEGVRPVSNPLGVTAALQSVTAALFAARGVTSMLMFR